MCAYIYIIYIYIYIHIYNIYYIYYIIYIYCFVGKSDALNTIKGQIRTQNVQNTLINIMVMRSKGLFCHKHFKKSSRRKILVAYIVKITTPSLNNQYLTDLNYLTDNTVSQWCNLDCLFPYVLQYHLFLLGITLLVYVALT